MDNPLLESALAYLARGCSIMPVHAGNSRDKDPHASLLIRSGYTKLDPTTNEVRASWKPLQEALPTEKTVRQWFARPEGVGLALITGAISRRIVVDWDGDEGRAFAERLGLRPHVRTGGGYHHHFKAPPWRVGNLVGKNTAGAPDCIDVRGDGGNAILPPTRTRKGPYLQLRDPDDLDDLEVLGIDLREALRLIPPVHSTRVSVPLLPQPSAEGRFPSGRILEWAMEAVQSGTKGGRNDVGYTLAWALYNNGYSHDEVAQLGRQYVGAVATLGAHPYTYGEFQASMRSAYQAPRGEAWGRDTAYAPKPRNEQEALEDVFASLSPEDQERATALFVQEWLAKGQPLDQAITYLRLIGHPNAAKAARAAYIATHEQRQIVGTLQGFLQARRVRFGRGG